MKLPPNHVPGLGVVKPTAYGGLGERLLKTMGWEQGQGLGRQGTGMKTAIEAKRKEDNSGVSAILCYRPLTSSVWECGGRAFAKTKTYAFNRS